MFCSLESFGTVFPLQANANNVASIHGIWDQRIEWTGPYLKGHTNLTEIEDGLNLLWRNGITPDQVVIGYGFYSRGFQMANPSCNQPPNCQFSGPSFPGDCTNEAGILLYAGKTINCALPLWARHQLTRMDPKMTEVVGHKKEFSSEVFYDKQSSVKWMIYGSNEWISFDDAQSFKKKLEYQSFRCLKGLMIWAFDLDTPDFKAIQGLFGEKAIADAIRDTSLRPKDKRKLVEDLAEFTGQNCYVTPAYTGRGRETDPQATCSPGCKSVELAHAPWQLDQLKGLQKCKEGEWYHVCCPTKYAPINCEWIGAPERNVFGCSRGCGDNQFELTTDSYVDFKGKGLYGYGRKSVRYLQPFLFVSF